LRGTDNNQTSERANQPTSVYENERTDQANRSTTSVSENITNLGEGTKQIKPSLVTFKRNRSVMTPSG